MELLFKIGRALYEDNKYRQVEITYKFDGERFSASGGIWNGNKTDYITCGQILEEIADLFPDDEMVQRITKVWREYHLNDLTAGSPKQEEFIAQKGLSRKNYDEVKLALNEAGLDPDPDYLYKEHPYVYGSAWLKTDIPDSIKEEIASWANEDSRISSK